MKSIYTDILKEAAAKFGEPDADLVEVEEWIRVEHGTMDHLSRARLFSEVKTALDCIAYAKTPEGLAMMAGIRGGI